MVQVLISYAHVETWTIPTHEELGQVLTDQSL
jgi:hypothetical protein